MSVNRETQVIVGGGGVLSLRRAPNSNEVLYSNVDPQKTRPLAPNQASIASAHFRLLLPGFCLPATPPGALLSLWHPPLLAPRKRTSSLRDGLPGTMVFTATGLPLFNLFKRSMILFPVPQLKESMIYFLIPLTLIYIISNGFVI